MTLKELEARLAEHGIPDPATDARLLISHLFGVSPALLLAERGRDYKSDALEDAVTRRCARVPLQHILGEVWFYGERYTVSRDCLSPRADTELLVEDACRTLPEGVCFADLCTGSGCIALSVLLHRPDLSAIAVDVSESALAIARSNAEALGLSSRVRFVLCDIIKDELSFPLPDYILSNPPYIRTDVIPTLAPELSYEPRIALDGGDDGLLFYRAMLERFSPRAFYFEIGFDQREAVCALGEEKGYRARASRDAGGCDRLVVLEKAPLFHEIP